MPKNIVICADGTGNSTIKGRGTNVFKLYEAVDQNGHRLNAAAVKQVAIYPDGVGTETLKWIRMINGATGWGLSRNVKQLYGELARVYETGDRIYLFGFSRGAFTVRTLAGFITTCGIVDPALCDTSRDFWKQVRLAYKKYRKKYQTRLSVWLRGECKLDPAQLRAELGTRPMYDEKSKLIEFIGVWDTVDAVGLPIRLADFINDWLYRFKFKNHKLSAQVRHAYHAIAADEQRESFAPLLWDERDKNTVEDQTIEQVWFAGVHSNVGGGYPRHGLSLVALDWMMTKAESCGLRFVNADRQAYRQHTDVDDKMYDSRRGFGVFYRWQPRDIGRLCEACGVEPRLHRSMFERIARSTEDYAPGSVPTKFAVESTSLPRPALERLGALVSAHHQSIGMPLMRKHRRWITFGRFSYWGFVYAVFALVLLTVADLASGAPSMSPADVGRQIVATFRGTSWLALTFGALWRHPIATAILALALGAGMVVDAYLDRLYSGFWYQLRGRLNAALEERAAGPELRIASGS